MFKMLDKVVCEDNSYPCYGQVGTILRVFTRGEPQVYEGHQLPGLWNACMDPDKVYSIDQDVLFLVDFLDEGGDSMYQIGMPGACLRHLKPAEVVEPWRDIVLVSTSEGKFVEINMSRKAKS
jgi:hypothetical protein